MQRFYGCRGNLSYTSQMGSKRRAPKTNGNESLQNYGEFSSGNLQFLGTGFRNKNEVLNENKKAGGHADLQINCLIYLIHT